jgi:hypothetical protein
MQQLYIPLDKSKEEIRLITLLPSSRKSEIVRCTLETRSLKSLTQEYEFFLAEVDSPPVSKSETIARWVNSRSPARRIFSANDEYIHINTPPRNCYRFTFGDYAALSYVWGDERQTRKIIVNDQEMQVTQNLEQALRKFRKQSEFQVGFGLWVDAICINQRDFEERGSQVQRMRQIYGQAWAVIAWLGEEERESDKAIQLVRQLADHWDHEAAHNLEARLRRNPVSLGDGSWYALNELMDRPYWYRLWIIQEIVMGASSLVVQCGDSSIDWGTFCTGIRVLQEYLWFVKDKLLQREARDGSRNLLLKDAIWSTTSLHLVYRELSMLTRRNEPMPGLMYWRILDIANAADCRDPRDKIYGLIGLMGSRVANHIIPNYATPAHEAYAEVARVFVEIYQSLDPLREGNPWGPTKTPSWAADWQWQGRNSLARVENPVWGPPWLFGSFIHDNSAYLPYIASKETKPEFSFTGTQLLTCTGFIVDAISGLTARGSGYFAWSKSSIIQDKHWKSIYGGIAETSKALYTNLVVDRAGQEEKASDYHAAILNLPSTFEIAKPQFDNLGWNYMAGQDMYYFRWQEWRKANSNFIMGDLCLGDFFGDVIPVDASEHEFTEVYFCFDRTCQKRRFMLTKNGYMGWAPDNIYGKAKDQTMEGDLIAILFGCSTPIVIRPYGEHFKVVGEAYVQGIMDGEAMELFETGKVEKQSFTFC